MKYEYYFCEFYKKDLEKYLCVKGIKYKKSECNITGDRLIFSLWSNNSDLERTLNELRNLRVRDPIVFVTYSASEINTANWLVLTPKKQSIDIVNSEEAYEYSCEWISSMGVEKVNHKRQKDSFVVKKEPSMKTSTAFWTEDTGFAELFADYRVCEMVKDNSLRGIKFENVRNKKGICSEHLFQVKTSNIICNDHIEFGHGERKEVCHICGKEQFFIDDTYQLHLNVSELEMQDDLYVTERIWGEGIAYPLYIISQRFYQLLKQNKLLGGLNLSPVVEILE